MPGSGASPWRAVVRGLSVLLVILTPHRGHAEPATAPEPGATASAADLALRDEIMHLLADVPSGKKDQVCPALDGPYWRIPNVSDPELVPDVLQAPRDSLQLLRCSKGCCSCSNCPKVEVPVPNCQALSERFERRHARCVACAGACPGAEQLGDDLLMTFVDLVKKCDLGDARVVSAASKISIVAAPKDVVARMLVLLGIGKVAADDAYAVLERILKIDQAPLRDRALKALAAWAHGLAKGGNGPSEQSVLDLFIAASELLAKKISSGGITDVAAILARFGSDQNAKDALELLIFARDLEDPAKAESIRSALETLVRKHPKLREWWPPDHHSVPIKELVGALMMYLNNAHIAELNRAREAAGSWPTVANALRRLRLKVATHLQPCVDAPTSDECKAAQSFRSAFVNTLKGEALQSADEVSVDGGVELTARDAEQVLRREKDGCAALDRGKKPKSHQALCMSPFAGFVGLDVRVKPAAPRELQASAFWVVRGVNDVVEPCNRKGGTCPMSESRAEPASAVVGGAELARRTLDQSGALKHGNPNDDPRSKESSFAKRWRQIGRPVALIGTLGLVMSGLYVSNTKPKVTTGDWLLRSGLALIVIEIGVEGCLLIAC